MCISDSPWRTKEKRGFCDYLIASEGASIDGVRAVHGGIPEDSWNISVVQAALTRLLVQLRMRCRRDQKCPIDLINNLDGGDYRRPACLFGAEIRWSDL